MFDFDGTGRQFYWRHDEKIYEPDDKSSDEWLDWVMAANESDASATSLMLGEY